MLFDDGKAFFARFAPKAPRGWYSFDQAGVHFIALNNVQNFKAGGMGSSMLAVAMKKHLDKSNGTSM